MFTPDSDSFKARAADRYLAGGGAKLRPSKSDLHHIIFAFNRHDARALERLGRVPKAELPPSEKSQNEPGDQIGTDPKTERSKEEPDRDVAYRIAVRGAMELIRKELNAASLRWTATVHRHTSNPHVHLLLHKDYEDATTGETKRLPHRLPLDWLNGRDEDDKPKGGLLDRCLSEALDPLVPPRPNATRRSSSYDAGPSDGRSSQGDGTRPRPQITIKPFWDYPAVWAAWAPPKSSASKAQSAGQSYRRSTWRQQFANPARTDDEPGGQSAPHQRVEAQPDRREATSPQPGHDGLAAKRVPNPEPRDPQKVPLPEPPQPSLEHSVKRDASDAGRPRPFDPAAEAYSDVTSTRSSPPPSEINSVHVPRMRGRNRAGTGSRTKAARPRAPGNFFSPARLVNAACTDLRARSLAGGTMPESPTPT